MHSDHYDYKSDLTSSKYYSSEGYSSNKRQSKGYQPYNGYGQKRYDQDNRSYQTYSKYRNEKLDKSDYLSPNRRQYKYPNDYRNSVNILPSYQNDLSSNKQKRKHTIDYTTSRNHSPHLVDYKKQKYNNNYNSKNYQPSHLKAPAPKYDLTSSSVSAITSFDYNSRKKNYLDSSRVDQLAKSHVSSIQCRNYDNDFQKGYKKDVLKEKYDDYFSPTNTTKTTAADDYQSPRLIVSPPYYKTEQVSYVPHKSPQYKQYTSKSAREEYNRYDYDNKYGTSKYDNQDKYKVSSFNSSSQQKLDTRFAKKKYQDQSKSKTQEINELLSKSRKVNQYDSKISSSKEQSVYTRKTQSIPSKIDSSVKISDFNIGRSKGQGKFGTVYQAIHKATGSLYAIKKIPKQIIKSHMLEGQLALQIKLQMYIDHPNILKMYGFFDDWQNVYIVLEYMEQGTLFEYLKKRSNKLTQKQASKKIKQMTDAIKYLHDLDIAHRDIKPENIVISNGVAKLCDFGWATRCTDRRKTYCGTFDYAAPQILQGRQYDWCVDLWCLGVLTFELLVGKAPFYHISRKQTMKKILRIDRDQIDYPKDMSWKAKDFIQSLLKKNPNERRTAEQLVNHPFLVDQK